MFDDYDEDDLFDEMMDYGMFEECEKRSSNNKPNGSCLSFIVCMSAMIAVPVALFVRFVVV